MRGVKAKSEQKFELPSINSKGNLSRIEVFERVRESSRTALESVQAINKSGNLNSELSILGDSSFSFTGIYLGLRKTEVHTNSIPL